MILKEEKEKNIYKRVFLLRILLPMKILNPIVFF